MRSFETLLIMSVKSLDIFYVFVDTGRSRLFEDDSTIKLMADDWETEENSEASDGLLSRLTLQQKVSPLVHCKLSQICACWLHLSLYSYTSFF
jgi:hypothetical protein